MNQPYLTPESESLPVSDQKLGPLDSAAIWGGGGLLLAGILGLITMLMVRGRGIGTVGPPIDICLGLGILVVRRYSLVRLAHLRLVTCVFFSLAMSGLNGHFILTSHHLLYVGLVILLFIKGVPILKVLGIALTGVALGLQVLLVAQLFFG